MDTPPSQTIRLPGSLEECRITTLPPAAYYIANFISEEEEENILRKVKLCLDLIALFARPNR